MGITALVREDLKQRIDSNNGLMVIEFWNRESGNCDIMEPVFLKLSEEHKNSIQFFRMHVDQNNVIPAELNLAGVPSYAVYKNNVLIEVINGITPLYKLKHLLSSSEL